MGHTEILVGVSDARGALSNATSTVDGRRSTLVPASIAPHMQGNLWFASTGKYRSKWLDFTVYSFGQLREANIEDFVAEREGFEPPIALRLCLISSQVHSTGLCHLSAWVGLFPIWRVRRLPSALSAILRAIPSLLGVVCLLQSWMISSARGVGVRRYG
jgi:hypothetical protein